MSQVKEPQNVEASKQSEAQIAPATPVEKNNEETTIRLTKEGQARLIELLENEDSKPPSETMQRAKQVSDQLFGATH